MNTLGIVPEGVLAMAGESLRRQQDAERRCIDLLRREGFEPVLLPVLEYDDGERGRGYRFVDSSGRTVALRTDFTPVAMRVLAPALERAALPVSVCYAGEVVRPRPARLRQLPELYQLGFERYGVQRGGLASLDLTVRLLRAVGIDPSSCHVAIGVAGLAEAVLAALTGTPPAADTVELLRCHDLDAIGDVTGLPPRGLATLEKALFAGRDDGWAADLGVGPKTALAAPLVDRCAELGIPASLDVAARPAGEYYRGAMFQLWGARTQAVVAAGGEYELVVGGRSVSAAGACLTLSLALEEATC